MLEEDPTKRCDINKIIESCFQNLKSKFDFTEEFDYQNGVKLGEGANGEVRKCASKLDNNREYAIKRIE